MTTNDFLNRDFLEGIKPDPKKEDASDRSFGQMLTDYGVKLIEPVVTAGRTITGLARSGENEFLGGGDKGPAADVDRWLGRQQKAMQTDVTSPFQRGVEESKWFNRAPNERSAWDVWPQALASQAAGLILPGAAAVATGGGTAVGTAVAGGVLGVLDSGEAINSARDYIDQAPQADLLKLEPYLKYYRSNGGDDIDARHQLFKESVDLLDVAANVTANVLEFGTLGHALSRGGKKVSSNMLKFLGRAAFGVTEGGLAGAAEGAAGELTAQRAAVKQGRQDEVNIGKIVGAGEEAALPMAGVVGGLHAVRRGPADEAKPAGDQQYDAHIKARPDRLDTDVTTTLTQTITPAAAIDTGPPHPLYGGEQGQPQAQSHPMFTQSPDLAGEHPVFGPGEAAGPPAPPAGPTTSGPQVGGVWGQAMPGVQANVPPPGQQYGPPAPAPGMPGSTPAPGGGVWAGARTGFIPGQAGQTYGPPAPPPAPPVLSGPTPLPPQPPQRPTSIWAGAQPGIQGNVVPPRAPPPPRLPDPPGMRRNKTGEYWEPIPTPVGGGIWANAQPGVRRGWQAGPVMEPGSIHVSPEDAKKIRPGYRLVPGPNGVYELKTKRGKSVGRVHMVDPDAGSVPINFETDGVISGKGKALTSDDATALAEGRFGPTEGTVPAPASAASTRPSPPAAEEETGAPHDEHVRQRVARQLHAAPLRPGRATWHQPDGPPLEVEILDKEDPRGRHSWVRYNIPDREGRRQQGEGWIQNDQLEQLGAPPSAGGGPGAGPRGGGGEGGGGGGRGTFQEQLRAAAEQIFTPTNEPLTDEVEDVIRGGVAPAKLQQRENWADALAFALERRGRLMEADFPKEMRGKGMMDQFEWDTMIHAATRMNPQEVIEAVRRPPLGGGNPVLYEINARLKGRKERAADGAPRTQAERGGFAKVVRVPEGPVRMARPAEEGEAPAREPGRSYTTEEQTAQTARENIRKQERERQQREQPGEVYGPPAPERTGQLTIDEADLQTDIIKHNSRLADWADMDAGQRERQRRIYNSLQARADRLDALRFRRGQPELAFTINEPPKEPTKQKPKPALTSEQEQVARDREFNDILHQFSGYENRSEELVGQKWAQDKFKRLLEINKERKARADATRKQAAKEAWRPLPMPVWIYDAFSDVQGIPALGIASREAQLSPEQVEYRRAQRIARQPMVARPEIGLGEYWSGIFKTYWQNLKRSDKTKWLREAREGIGKRLSPEELKNVVIKEVERLHAAARKRAGVNLPPMPIRTMKIKGKRQARLPRHIPTEQEALDRLDEARQRAGSQERREKSGDKQYAEREEVIASALTTAVKARFGTQKRFDDLIASIFSKSLIRAPTREVREQPGLFQRARREKAFAGMPNVRLISKTKEGEARDEKQKAPADVRKKLTAAQQAREALEDQALQEGVRFSLGERLRRARQQERTLAGELAAAEEAEGITTPSQRQANLYAESMKDYFKVKDLQLADARKLKKFLDHLLEKLAKDLEAKRKKEGYTGGTIKWRLPQARLREKGLKISEQAEGAIGRAGATANAPIATRKHYSAGEANEKFGAYSFTADLLNMRETLDYAIKGIENLEKGSKLAGGTRVAQRSLQPRWDRKTGRRGKVVMPGQTGTISSRQQEIARYMSGMNRQMLDFSWRVQKALEGDWAALRDVRKAGTAEAERGFLGESLDEREEAQKRAEDEGIRAKEAVPRDEVGRGKSAQEIDERAARIADLRHKIDMANAYNLARREGRIGSNMSFEDYVEMVERDRRRALEQSFPLNVRGKEVHPLFGELSQVQAYARRAVEEKIAEHRRAMGLPPEKPAEKKADTVKRGPGGAFVRGISKGVRALTNYRKFGRRADIDELLMPAMGNNKGDYFIDPQGHLYEAFTNHPETFEAMDREAGYNVDNEESLYTTGDNPLVRVSSFTWHPDEEDSPEGYNHTVNVEAYKGGVTRAQKRTIDRIRREAESAARDGENIKYFDEVTTGYGGDYYVNMDAVTIRDEPYRGMPLDDDDTRDISGTHGFFSEDGLPTNRRRGFNSDDVDPDTGLPTAEAEARIGSYAQHDEAHVALFDPDNVEHPLVAKPETSAQVVDRVKQMLRDGTAGDMPARYVNEEFLDQLVRLTAGTQIYHAPYDTVRGPNSDRWGWYAPALDRIAISHDIAPDLYARSVIHELVHAAADSRLEQDPVFAREMAALLNEARAWALRKGANLNDRFHYGLSDPHEFLTESVSNKKFRDYLESVGGKPTVLRRLWNAIRSTFARAIGFIHGNTALDALYYDTSTVLGKTDKLIARTMKQIEMEGRKAPLPIDLERAVKNGDGRHFARGIGAKAFISDMYGETQAWGKDVANKAVYAGQTMGKERATGMDFMTQYDWTKIGPQEFRDHSANAFETIEKIFAEGNKLRDQDKRELGKAAKIFYRWSKGNRQKAAEGMIDESWHGYFADRELTDKGNEHFKDDLSQAQAREEHVKAQLVHKDLSENLEGYDEFRRIIHDFSAKREELMRRRRINDMVKHGTLIDPNMAPDLRQRLADAIRDWIDTDPKRLPGPPAHPLMGPPSRGALERFENLREVLERVPEKDFIKQHIDVSDPTVLSRVKEIRAVPENSRLPGPYVPFTRQGRYAITGNVDIPTPPNAIRLEGDINHATGQPIGNDRFVFRTEAEARAFEREITNRFGIKQLDGGVMDIDVNTGQRAMVPDKMERGDDPEKFQLARGKKLKELKDAGANIEDRYFVQFQRKHLYYFDNEYEAKQARDALIAEHGDSINLSHPLDVFVRDGRQNEQFVGTELQRQIDHMRQSVAFQRLDSHEQAAIIADLTLSAAQYVMKRGVKQRYLPRGFVKGPSTNVLGSMDEYSAYTGRYAAKVEHQAELDHRMNEMKTYLKANEHKKDVLAEQRVYNAMSQRLNSPTENPRDNFFNRWVDRALKWTMLDKLPGVGYFIANATDTVATGLPLMIGRHNAARAIAYMGRMYILSRKMRAFRNGGSDILEAIKNGVDMTDYEKEIMRAVNGEVDSSRLNDLYGRAFGRGVFDRSANLEYQNTYSTNKIFLDKTADWATGIFQGVNTAIENINRFVTLGTAYRLEFDRLTRKGEGNAHEKAIKYAMDIAHEANGIYANFNTPEYFNKGPIAKLIFQFKKYPQRILMNYIRAAMGTIKGVGEWTHGSKMSPENRERARQLAAMLITQGLMAGALGMPTEMFSIPLNTLWSLGLVRYNWEDAQGGFRQWAHDKFGKNGGQLVSHGVLRWMTGTAIDQRLSQNSLLTFGSPGGRKQNDLKVSVLNFLMGATGSSAFQAFNGLQKTSEGVTAMNDGAWDVAKRKFAEASKDLIPMRFITDIIGAANRTTPEGMQNYRGQQMDKPLSTGEALVRGITGLQTSREAEAYERRQDIKQYKETYQARRKQLSDAFAQSPPGLQRADISARVRKFNAEYPEMPPLTQGDLLKAAGTRAKAEKLSPELVGLPDDRYTKPLRKRGEVYVTAGG